MNFHFRSHQKYLTAFNFSSLTDIVMLLLIFFLLTSSFVVTMGLNVTLPKAVEGQPPLQRKIISVSIGKDKKLFLNNAAVAKTQLLADLKALLHKDQDQQVVVWADKDLGLQEVVEVLDIIRGAGASRLFIATESQKEGK